MAWSKSAGGRAGNSKGRSIIKKKNLPYLIAVILLLDQFVKYLIRTYFEVGESHPVIPNIFHITYVRNTGAAFSMFQNMPLMTFALPAVLMIGCGYAILRLYRQDMIMPLICVEMILGGGLGNMVDRVAQGFVVDMFDFRIFPVFNVADISITCGCALLMIWVIISDKLDKADGEKDV